MIPPEKKIERMVNVARLYYEQNMTQNEIAKELGISQATAARKIAKYVSRV